jgi:hypothetical protein
MQGWSMVNHVAARPCCSLEFILEGDFDHGTSMRRYEEGEKVLAVLTDGRKSVVQWRNWAGDEGNRRWLLKLIRRRFGIEERELSVGKDAVEDGEGVGAFYRPGGSGRWVDGKWPVT